MKKHSGFTLVEIIFSIAFLSIVSVVILQLFLSSDQLAKRAQTVNLATLYASNAIELAKAQANANDLPKTTEAEIEQFFDGYWRRVPGRDGSEYRLILTMVQSKEVSGIVHFKALVVDKEAATLSIIETAHYLKGGSQ